MYEGYFFYWHNTCIFNFLNLITKEKRMKIKRIKHNLRKWFPTAINWRVDKSMTIFPLKHKVNLLEGFMNDLRLQNISCAIPIGGMRITIKNIWDVGKTVSIMEHYGIKLNHNEFKRVGLRIPFSQFKPSYLGREL